jgi:hypothetical protein
MAPEVTTLSDASSDVARCAARGQRQEARLIGSGPVTRVGWADSLLQLWEGQDRRISPRAASSLARHPERESLYAFQADLRFLSSSSFGYIGLSS